ncbi:ankyrin [Anaeromyces robustus]|uniref:Ankyrin n=1 Tax=Anaeromyces robustus TaxID=1754192 RepID=A0A1Y1X256_9FUNG|nr:ankyrin [Anaeromyces robustus]|eukprot:ORX79486.1 ankyrin [Anaeromyces robustus]
MNYKTFETEFLLLLKNGDTNCLKLIDENKKIVEEYLGYHSDPKTLDKFVDYIGNIIVDIKNKKGLLIKKKNNNYELIEDALNHPSFGKVKGVFTNKSDVLIKALKNDNKSAANWLMTKMKINPKVQDENDKYGNNVLFYSVACKDFIANEIISNNTYPRDLIDSGIYINHSNHNGETALVYCIKKGNFRPIQYLLKNPSLDVNVADSNGKTAAMYLVEKGNYFDFLSLHRKDCNYDYININNYDSVLSIILKKMYGTEQDRNSVPYKAFIQIFTVLVTYQVDFNNAVDTDENTAFMAILNVKDLDSAMLCAKHLRRLDLSVKNKYGENATSLCFKFGYPDILNVVKENPTFNYYYRDPVNQNTLLMLSVVNKCLFMKELLEYDPNIINEVNLKAVEILLNYGIDVNHQDDLGNTALHYAIEINQPKLVQMIMKTNPKTNLMNKNNKTAIMLANEINNEEILRIINNPFDTIKTFNTNNNDHNEILDKYCKEAQSYITPYINNNYPEYKCTKEMEKIKDEIYFRFVGTPFRKTIINNIIIFLFSVNKHCKIE